MVSLLAASAWDYKFHPEVWLLVAAIIGLGVYSVRNIGPLAVPAGEPGPRAAHEARRRAIWRHRMWHRHGEHTTAVLS